MKKFLSLMLALMMLMSLSSVSSYASDDDSDDTSVESRSSDSDDDSDEDESDDSGMDSDDDMHDEDDDSDNRVRPVREKMMSGTGMMMRGSGALMKEQRHSDKEMLKEKREMMKSEIEANREEAKMNRDAFRSENSDDIDDVKSQLTDDQKIALEALRDTHKAEMDALREKVKTASSTEARQALYAEMKALAETHYSEVASVLGEDAATLVAERKAVWQENEMLRDDNRAMRNEYKEVKRTTVEKYRKAFVSKLGNSLDKIPAEKLPQIVERINTMMEKEGTSETMMAALTAILELVEEKMEGDDVESDVLDVVESLLQ